MTEAAIVRQNKDFEIAFWVLHEDENEEPAFIPAEHIYDLSPYTMLLTSLGSCTTVLLHTYAQYHEIGLEEVEIRLQYARVFDEDCKNCEEIDAYEEQIEEEYEFFGDLTEDERKRLFHIAKQCPVYKMLHDGVTVSSRLAEAKKPEPESETLKEKEAKTGKKSK